MQEHNMKIDLLEHIKEGKSKVNIITFKDSVLGLFKEMLLEDITKEQRNEIARLRSRIEIGLKDL